MNEFAPSSKMFLLSIAALAIGIALFVLGNAIDNGGIGVLGGGITGFSIVLIVRLIQAKLSPKFAKEVTISKKDERQKQIYVYGGNAAFWLGLLYIIASSILIRTENIMLMFAPAVMLLAFVGTSVYYSRKF